MKKINHLDCTLRDGGYYNNWNFSKKFINEYLRSVHQAGIEYVELGFCQIKKDKKKGLSFNVDRNLIDNLKIPENLKIGVMINASDILFSNISPQYFLKFILKQNENKNRLSLLRIACHFNEINKIIPFLKILKNSKLLIAINLMQITEKKESEVKTIIKRLAKEKIHILYFADSLGSLKKNDVKKLITQIRKYCKFKVGFHAHDNIGKAKINTRFAIVNDIDWFDTTIMGMGRGAGNAKTEDFILKNSKHIIDKLILKRFLKLKKVYNWGNNKYYNLSARFKIHPTYVQEIIKKYKNLDSQIIKIIQLLKNQKSNNFDENKLNRLLSK